MKVALTGATGRLGQALQAALGETHQVVTPGQGDDLRDPEVALDALFGVLRGAEVLCFTLERFVNEVVEFLVAEGKVKSNKVGRIVLSAPVVKRLSPLGE